MSTFRIAVAGCGGMAAAWVEYALKRTDTEIVALVDIYENSAKAMATRYHLNCPTFTDISEAIRATSANLVFDVTIPDSHKQVTIAALELGCNVFGEKPMAASMADAREMIAASERSGKQYAVMQNRRYNQQIRAYRSILTEGTIGQPGIICADFFLAAHFGGFRDAMESPLLLDMAIHTFDQARFITGADPISVYCHEFNPSGSWYKGNAAAICIYEMSDGSAFNYRGSWCAEGNITSWECDWRISGSKGTAMWDGTNEPYYEIVAPSQEAKFINDFTRVQSDLTWKGSQGHEGCLNEMFASLLENRLAETVCTDNIKSMAMVFGALESAKTGQKVLLS